MTNRFGRASLALCVLMLLTFSLQAQLSGLKNKLKNKIAEKGGLSKTLAGPTQWKEGERVPPLTTKDLDRFLADWKMELKHRGLSDAERERLEQETARKSEQRERCKASAITPAVAMAIGEKFERRMNAAAGDEAALKKISVEIQNDMEATVDRKCGPEPADPRAISGDRSYILMKEWMTAYLGVRKEKGAEAASQVVLATPAESNLIEAHLDTLQGLASTEEKLDAH